MGARIYSTRLFSLALFVGMVLSPTYSKAEEGIINAVSFRPIPVNAAVVVKPWDNSDENLRTARIIESQLQSLGYTLSPKAKLTLSFETKKALGKWSGESKNNSVEFKAESSTATGKEAEVRLNLFSSSEGGILNPSRKHGENTLTKMSLEITLDQQNGPRLWQGEAFAGIHQTDSGALVRRLTPLLLDQLGKTVRRKTVQIP